METIRIVRTNLPNNLERMISTLETIIEKKIKQNYFNINILNGLNDVYLSDMDRIILTKKESGRLSFWISLKDLQKCVKIR